MAKAKPKYGTLSYNSIPQTSECVKKGGYYLTYNGSPLKKLDFVPYPSFEDLKVPVAIHCPRRNVQIGDNPYVAGSHLFSIGDISNAAEAPGSAILLFGDLDFPSPLPKDLSKKFSTKNVEEGGFAKYDNDSNPFGTIDPVNDLPEWEINILEVDVPYLSAQEINFLHDQSLGAYGSADIDYNLCFNTAEDRIFNFETIQQATFERMERKSHYTNFGMGDLVWNRVSSEIIAYKPKSESGSLYLDAEYINLPLDPPELATKKGEEGEILTVKYRRDEDLFGDLYKMDSFERDGVYFGLMGPVQVFRPSPLSLMTDTSSIEDTAEIVTGDEDPPKISFATFSVVHPAATVYQRWSGYHKASKNAISDFKDFAVNSERISQVGSVPSNQTLFDNYVESLGLQTDSSGNASGLISKQAYDNGIGPADHGSFVILASEDKYAQVNGSSDEISTNFIQHCSDIEGLSTTTVNKIGYVANFSIADGVATTSAPPFLPSGDPWQANSYTGTETYYTTTTTTAPQFSTFAANFSSTVCLNTGDYISVGIYPPEDYSLSPRPANRYLFNNLFSTAGNDPFKMNSGTYVFSGIPSDFPIAFSGSGLSGNFSYTGLGFVTSVTGADDQVYNFYSGIVTGEASGDFGTGSYFSTGEAMFGQNNLIFDTGCA